MYDYKIIIPGETDQRLQSISSTVVTAHSCANLIPNYNSEIVQDKSNCKISLGKKVSSFSLSYDNITS